MSVINYDKHHESNNPTLENRKKVFNLLDNITEEDIKPYQSYRPDDFDLSKSVIEFKNLLNSGVLLTSTKSFWLTVTRLKPIFDYIYNKLKIEKGNYEFREEALSAYVGPGKIEDQILTNPIKTIVTTKISQSNLLEEISQNLSKKEVEYIKNNVIKEHGFLHPTAFAQALEDANQGKKNTNVINTIGSMGEKEAPVEDEEYDNIQKIKMPNQNTIRNYVLKSVQLQMNYFAEKWQGIALELADKDLTKLDAYSKILHYKEKSVDPMAKESLDINMFLGLLFNKKQ